MPAAERTAPNKRWLYLAWASLALAALSPPTLSVGEPVYRGEFCWEKRWHGEDLTAGRLRLHVLSYGAGALSVNGEMTIRTGEAGAPRSRDVLTHGNATWSTERIDLDLSLSSVFSPQGPVTFTAVLDPAGLAGRFEEQGEAIDPASGEIVSMTLAGILVPVPCETGPAGG